MACEVGKGHCAISTASQCPKDLDARWKHINTKKRHEETISQLELLSSSKQNLKQSSKRRHFPTVFSPNVRDCRNGEGVILVNASSSL